MHVVQPDPLPSISLPPRSWSLSAKIYSRPLPVQTILTQLKPFPTHTQSFGFSRRSQCVKLITVLLVSDCSVVAVRNQASTLRHTIRHQQAQLNNLENIIRSSPRGFQEGTEDMTSPSSSPFDSTPSKVRRRLSYDVLHSIAGPDSSLPLPRRDGMDDNGIQEGVPMNYGSSPTTPPYKRPSSPTRTLSRTYLLYSRHQSINIKYIPPQVSQLHQ